MLRVLSQHACSWGVATIVGFLNLYVSFAKEPYKRDYKRDYVLQKRPMISWSLLHGATPCQNAEYRPILTRCFRRVTFSHVQLCCAFYRNTNVAVRMRNVALYWIHICTVTCTCVERAYKRGVTCCSTFWLDTFVLHILSECEPKIKVAECGTTRCIEYIYVESHMIPRSDYKQLK